MALPVTLSNLTAGTLSTVGPFRSSAGNYYVFGRSSADTTKIQAQKATDPTSSFSAVGTDDTFGQAAGARTWLAARQDGNTIHLAVGITSNSTFRYNSFDMATDTWGTGTPIMTGWATTSPFFAIAVRTGSDLVVAGRGLTENVMGTNYQRVIYNKRVSGTWDGAVTDVAGTGGQFHFVALGIVLGASDSVHIFYLNFTSSLLIQRTLNSSNSLQTASTGVAMTGAGTTGLDTGGQGVSYASGGATKVIFIGDDNGTIKSYYFDSANTPTINVATVEASAHASARAFASVDGTDAYAGYVIAADSDVYVEKSTDHGATWTGKTDVATATVANAVGNLGLVGSVYLRGGNYQLGFTYNDGGTLKYNEFQARIGDVLFGQACL